MANKFIGFEVTKILLIAEVLDGDISQSLTGEVDGDLSKSFVGEVDGETPKLIERAAENLNLSEIANETGAASSNIKVEILQNASEVTKFYTS